MSLRGAGLKVKARLCVRGITGLPKDRPGTAEGRKLERPYQSSNPSFSTFWKSLGLPGPRLLFLWPCGGL